MGEPELKRMTPEAFLVWQQDQEQNFELVDGLPVLPLKAMTGATHAHDRVTVNLLRELSVQLRRKRCQPATDDIALRIPNGNIRRPDVMVERGPIDLTGTAAVEPKLVAEVLSPSTMNLDRFRKLEEYKTVPSLAYILLLDTTRPQITLYVREGTQWMRTHDELGAVIELPEIGCRLASVDLFLRGSPVSRAGRLNPPAPRRARPCRSRARRARRAAGSRRTPRRAPPSARSGDGRARAIS